MAQQQQQPTLQFKLAKRENIVLKNEFRKLNSKGAFKISTTQHRTLRDHLSITSACLWLF